MDICVYCVQPITGTMISTGNGMAHTACYYRAHPFVPKDTFWQVLHGEDQELMRELIEHYMPEALQADIVREYNARARAWWEQRCEG